MFMHSYFYENCDQTCTIPQNNKLYRAMMTLRLGVFQGQALNSFSMIYVP